MKNMNDTTREIKPQALSDQFAQLLEFVQTAFAQERTAHEVEKGLWERILKLGRSLFGAWLELCGDGDAGDRLVLDDGREVRRLDALHRREIVSFRQACMKFRPRPDSVVVSFLANRRPYDVTVPPAGRCRSGAGRRGLGRLAQHEARAHAGPGSVLVASG